ncbi:M23 family metallopeptidase [Fervidobacterium nodosum]|uniref:Peptidase M23B n=1 Tax=Fervidobacterium nodosum (strain ATCC 35602 / DSM 5306 / Rt17-B1) TaxID=381764 RepID=A7HJA7_FERNB|nr:M23 family metallopeptidase [Fervidobacterium nodosum]ABS59990.1 peptidase M23B [Fervidobacterium nodosum Rt17-B1]
MLSRKYAFLTSIFLSFIYSVFLFALYMVPVDNSYITATFMEFRSTGNIPHFHSGIDFSTFLKEGIPVKAVEDGYLVRLEIDEGGIYGKTLVLQHADGYRTLYAHLSKFSEKLDKLVSMMNEEFGNQRVVVEIYSDEYKFQRGEVIGYSGSTGEATKPHAHFEVRSSDEKFFYDPLKFIDKNLLRPVSMNILLKSVRIEGKEYPFVENGVYYFSERYPKISIEAYTELAKNLLGVKEIKVYFSENLVYHIILDEVPEEYWNKPYEVYDEEGTIMTGLIYRGFYKLYNNKNVSFVKENKIESQTGNLYNVRIEITDEFGNNGVFRFTLQRR